MLVLLVIIAVFFCRLLFFCSCRMSKRKISYSETCTYDEDALLTITDTDIQKIRVW